MQIAACIPNFALQEYPTGKDQSPKSNMVTGIPKHDGKGFPLSPDPHGIGVELKLEALQKCPMTDREVVACLYLDGSVADA